MNAGGYRVRYTDRARDDLLRLFDFLLDRAQTADDFDHAQRVIDTVHEAITNIRSSCRWVASIGMRCALA